MALHPDVDGGVARCGECFGLRVEPAEAHARVIALGLDLGGVGAHLTEAGRERDAFVAAFTAAGHRDRQISIAAFAIDALQAPGIVGIV